MWNDPIILSEFARMVMTNVSIVGLILVGISLMWFEGGDK